MGGNEAAIAGMSYRDLAFQASSLEDIPIFFQIRNGALYRNELKQTLQRVVADSSLSVAAAMEECRSKWDELTTSFGRDQQQQSLEKTLGLRQ